MTVPGEPRKGHTDWVLEGGGESLHVAPAVRKDSTEENALLRGHVSPTLISTPPNVDFGEGSLRFLTFSKLSPMIPMYTDV